MSERSGEGLSVDLHSIHASGGSQRIARSHMDVPGCTLIFLNVSRPIGSDRFVMNSDKVVCG